MDRQSSRMPTFSTPTLGFIGAETALYHRVSDHRFRVIMKRVFLISILYWTPSVPQIGLLSCRYGECIGMKSACTKKDTCKIRMMHMS